MGSSWDLDTRLGFPLPAITWLDQSLPQGIFAEEFAPFFRVMDAEVYVGELRSDRGHMRNPDGSWLAPPPNWPPISAPEKGSNLMAWVDVEGKGPGEVLDRQGFAHRLRAQAP
jgi:hypothetical protein